jgi:hypothetical protein
MDRNSVMRQGRVAEHQLGLVVSLDSQPGLLDAGRTLFHGVS